MIRKPKRTSFNFSIAAAILALCCGLGTVSASNTGSVVEINQPARGQGSVGIPRPNGRDSVLSGGLLNGLPASAVNFDRCLQDDTQLGCANYCTANPNMCGTTSPGGSGGLSKTGRWKMEDSNWGYTEGGGSSYENWDWWDASSKTGGSGSGMPPIYDPPCAVGSSMRYERRDGWTGGDQGYETYSCIPS